MYKPLIGYKYAIVTDEPTTTSITVAILLLLVSVY